MNEILKNGDMVLWGTITEGTITARTKNSERVRIQYETKGMFSKKIIEKWANGEDCKIINTDPFEDKAPEQEEATKAEIEELKGQLREARADSVSILEAKISNRASMYLHSYQGVWSATNREGESKSSTRDMNLSQALQWLGRNS
jgi:hypothetical protein